MKRHKAYDNYYILYKFIISTFESICNKSLYEDFYQHLEGEINETWSWDKETVSKAQGLFVACRRFDRLTAFSVLFNGLEPLKPLVTKLQKRNQDIYQAYHMIDQVLNDLKKTKTNITEEFKLWFQFAVDMAKSVGVSPSVPRIAKCWSRFRNNVPSEDHESYYRRAIAIPLMNALITNLGDRMEDRNHTELFSLLPTVCLSPQFNFENSVSSLLRSFATDLPSGKTPIIFRSEMKRWISYCQNIEKKKKDSEKSAKKKMRVDGSAAYQLNEPTDSFLDAIKLADPDSFPNIRQLLTIGCILPIGSTEAERAASGVRRLTTSYRSTMGEDRESDLNFLQL